MPPGPPGARPTLRAGSRGAAVGEAQRLLNAAHAHELAAGRPGLPGAPLAEDGVFGRGTGAAALAFQRLAFPGEPRQHDGVIGPDTWARLSGWGTGRADHAGGGEAPAASAAHMHHGPP